MNEISANKFIYWKCENVEETVEKEEEVQTV